MHFIAARRRQSIAEEIQTMEHKFSELPFPALNSQHSSTDRNFSESHRYPKRLNPHLKSTF